MFHANYNSKINGKWRRYVLVILIIVGFQGVATECWLCYRGLEKVTDVL